MKMRSLTKLNELSLSFFLTLLGFVVVVVISLGQSSDVKTSSLQVDFCVYVILAKWHGGGRAGISGFERKRR